MKVVAGLFFADSETLRIFGCVREFALTEGVMVTGSYSLLLSVQRIYLPLNFKKDNFKMLFNFSGVTTAIFLSVVKLEKKD